MRILAIVMLVLLLIFPVSAQDQTLAATAAANPDLSTLVTLLSTADLVGVLDSPDVEFTVFAPSNAAFENVPTEIVAALMADPALLTRVLTYHVVEGTYTSEELAELAAAPSMEMEAVGATPLGSELEFTVTDDGGINVKGANVITADILASNGVIHIIDAVLVPAGVGEALGLTTEPAATRVFGTSNPAGFENDMIYTSDMMLTEVPVTTTSFAEGDIASVEGIAFDSFDSVYLNLDLAIDEAGVITAGGIRIYEGFIGGAAEDMVERTIAGENTGLIAPKGLQVLETIGVIAVGDNGAKDIKLFPISGEGDIEPSAVLSIGEGGSVWDVWYDILNDSLYATKTNGDLIAYDFFSETLGENGPDRIITPTDADGNKISINLHGIDIDYDSNTVILTDVGDAAVNTDGQIFLMRVVSISDGPTPVDARIFGEETMLGNPIDLIFNGSGIYVTEKANDLLLYYENILDYEGESATVADVAVPLLKAEGVAMHPTREKQMIIDMGLEIVE